MSSTSQRQPASQETSATLASFIRKLIPLRGGLGTALAVVGGLIVLLGIILLLFVQELRVSAGTILAIGGILLLAALMTSYATVLETITGRRGRYSTNTLVMITAFIALASLLYVVAVRNTVRWDTTFSQEFSLAPQTLDILKDLAEPVQATAFFVPGNPQQEQFRVFSENLLNEFEYRSSGKFSYRFIDPDREPTLANQYGVTQYPTIAFRAEDAGIQTLLATPPFEERDFASALLITTGVQRKRIYYLEGHGERVLQDLEPASHQGFGFAKAELQADNYHVIALSLAQIPEIPSDASTIIIAGPDKDLTEQEIQIVYDYLRKGGRLLLLLEPDPLPAFKDLLARWAITVNDGTVVDLASSLSGQPQTPLIKREQYFTEGPISAITAALDQSYLPGTASFGPSLPPEEMPDSIIHYPIARTTLLSCLTPDPAESDCSVEGFGIRVPAMALQAVAPINEDPMPNAPQETKIVIFGDTDFATNFHLYSLSNRDMLLNTVNWLTEDISLASVRPKIIAFRFMVVTARQMQLIRGLSWIVLPAGMVLLAGVAWWRRR